MIKKIILVDDEDLSRLNLRSLINRYTDWHIAAELESAVDIEQHVAVHKPDLVFLDIKMPRRDGICAANGLLRLNSPPLVIFVSAYSEYALQAFDVYALDYLLKPFSDERFLQTVARLSALAAKPDQHNLAKQQQANLAKGQSFIKYLVVRSVSMIRIIDVDEIIWLMSSGNYVEVVLKNERVLHRAALSSLQECLDTQVFYRCHRSAMVRLSAIKSIKTLAEGQFQLILDNGDCVKLSPAYKDDLLAAFEAYH
jgi:two-component system, LytTR family, response regulator